MATIEDLSLIPDTFSSVLFADYFDFTSDPPATKRLCFFFFQAEDGIRDTSVTGVQTCGLPILEHPPGVHQLPESRGATAPARCRDRRARGRADDYAGRRGMVPAGRSRREHPEPDLAGG